MESNESEIKIEYYDNNESDPLSETVTSQNNCSLEEEEYVSWYHLQDSKGKLHCQYCELKYSTAQTLRHHVKLKHPEKVKQLHSSILTNKRNKKHICHICKQRFKNVSDLKLHVDLDHSIDFIKSSCLYCDATFMSNNSLKDHILIKHNICCKFIYTCDICGYRTLKKSHFKQHNNVHMKNKIYMCDHCDYRTNYSPNLKIHRHIHTNNKLYVCEVKTCTYRCTAKSGLSSHMLKHYPEKNMLYCDRCSYKTVYKQSLKKHLGSHERNSIRLK